MRSEPLLNITGHILYEADRLDPITVILHDFRQGMGRLILECYGSAWSATWGAIGARTLRDFLVSCDPQYVANAMASATRMSKREEAHLLRVVTAAIEFLNSNGGN